MAANPLLTDKARSIFSLDWSFSTWLLGSFPPSLLALLLLPLTMRLLSPANVDVTHVRRHVDTQLANLGRPSRREYVLVAVLVTCLLLWVTSRVTGLDATVAGTKKDSKEGNDHKRKE